MPPYHLTVSSTAACTPSSAAEEDVSRAAGSASTADIQHGTNSNGHREPEKHGNFPLHTCLVPPADFEMTLVPDGDRGRYENGEQGDEETVWQDRYRQD